MRRLLGRAAGPMLLVLLSWSQGCASRLTVTVTPPEAQLAVENVTGGQPLVLGAGSASIDSNLLEQRSIRAPFLIRASAPGRAPLAVLVTKLPSSEQGVTLSLPLLEQKQEETTPEEPPEETPEEDKISLRVSNPMVWNETVRMVLEAERYLNQKQYDQALALAKSMQEKTPWLAVGFVLEASAHYLLQDRARARVALERATTLDPEDGASLQMLRTIEREMGLPSGTTGPGQ